MQCFFKRTLSVIMSGLCLLSAASLPAVMPLSEVYAADYQISDIIDGYYYECWNQNMTGEVDYKNTENNGFTFSWNSIVECFALKGERFERNTVFASQIKEYNVAYDEDVDYMASDSRSGVYGWMECQNEYIEFRIVDSWGSRRPETGNIIGSFESNGITYDIFITARPNMDFLGINSTPIYYSVAQENLAQKADGSCNIKNTINVADHFKAWSEAGLELGYMYDIGFSVQAYRSHGSANLNSLEITKEITTDTNYGPGAVYSKHDPLPVDEKGRTVYIDFETDNENVSVEDENSSAVYTSNHSFSGERSFLISGKGENECSFEYSIDPYDFRTNEKNVRELTAGMKIYHNGNKAVKFRISLATEKNNNVVINDISCRTICPGSWKNLEDIKLTLNNDLFSRQYLCITVSESVDFFIDDFYIANTDDYALTSRHIRGDVNDDNKTDIYDITELRKELIESEGYHLCYDYDVNGDYRLDVCDLILLTEYVLGKTDHFPESETGTLIEYGSFSKAWYGGAIDSTLRDRSIDDVKTAVRSDGTFMSEWNISDYYEITEYQEFDSADEISVKYSGLVKTTPHEKYSYKKGAELTITGSFQKDLSDILYIHVCEGFGKKESVDHDTIIDELETVDIGSKKYYKNTEKQKLGSDIVTWITLYDTEAFNICGEINSIEGKVDFAEIMEALDLEGYKPQKADFKFVSRNADGYADFKELSFISNSAT